MRLLVVLAVLACVGAAPAQRPRTKPADPVIAELRELRELVKALQAENAALREELARLKPAAVTKPAKEPFAIGTQRRSDEAMGLMRIRDPETVRKVREAAKATDGRIAEYLKSNPQPQGVHEAACRGMPAAGMPIDLLRTMGVFEVSRETRRSQFGTFSPFGASVEEYDLTVTDGVVSQVDFEARRVQKTILPQ